MTTLRAPWTTRPVSRRQLLSSAAVSAVGLVAVDAFTPSGLLARASGQTRPRPATEFDAAVPTAWFDLLLRLIRETPGYSPPVASRAIGCASLALYESIVPGMPGYVSLAGVANGLPSLPADGRNAAYHWPTVANAALATMGRNLFPTAPATALEAIDALEATFAAGAPLALAGRSTDRGRAVARAIDAWARTDGGHEAYLRNFPTTYTPPTGPGMWVPTAPGFQRALQPFWGSNRAMAVSSLGDLDPGPPPAFSTDAESAFFGEALEVYETVSTLTAEQAAIVQFWADDPGRTATPAGHSTSILTQLLRREDRSLAAAAEGYARLGLALCDAFIACWRTKFRYNLLRPITYIRDTIDPAFGDPLPVTTPPFPEYTSGHSVQSGAAATVLTALFGSTSFTDHTHDRLGLAARSFASFDSFAQEAAESRLYGGIHFRTAIERGLVQGRRIGSAAAALPLIR
jgi:hypothetical protein